MSKISVLILTFNEEDRLEECLKSVDWANEVVVVDSFSTDRTVEIAKKYTTKVFQQKWLGFAAQRNFALEKCSHNWILVLDADERVTSGLKEEILLVLKKQGDFTGYYIPRKTYFLGQPINYCGWYPDYVLRLFKKDKGKYGERMVHESVDLEGKAGHLKAAFLHYSYRNITHFMEKMNSYSTLGAEEMLKRGKSAKITDYLVRPLWTFLKMYLLRKGFLDGTRGFIISSISAFYVFLKYTKLWALRVEKQGG